MTPRQNDLIDSAHELLRSIERGDTGAALGRHFHPDAQQREFPSLISPMGGVRGLDDMLAASERGAGLLAWQRYDVQTAAVDGDLVVLQLTWTAALAVPLRDLPEGHVLVAHVAMFLRFRDGLVIEQNSYDCYEPLVPVAA